MGDTGMGRINKNSFGPEFKTRIKLVIDPAMEEAVFSEIEK